MMRGQTDNAERTRPGAGRTIVEADGERPLVPTVVRWPLDVEDGFATTFLRDPWQSMIRDSIVAYREGRADVASWGWADDIVWQIAANGFSEEHHGAEQIFAYHQALVRETGGTFRQRLVALQGSQSPIVEAFVQSTGRRRGRELKLSGLVVFELGGSRIRKVTEMPGDPEAWGRFWTD
jgi:hypothetical protein